MNIMQKSIWFLLTLGLILLGTLHLEMNRMSEQNALLLAENIEKQTEIETLSRAVSKLNSEIVAWQPKVEAYEALASFIDLDAFTLDPDRFQHAREISDATPLDFESASVLVKYADIYDIPYSLILSIIEIESNFTPTLVGTSQDRGYMQIIPGTEKWLATEFGEELGLTYDPNRIFEPSYNLALGIKYIAELMDQHGADYERILSEYNRGPVNLKRYYAANRTYSTTYSKTVLSRQHKYVALNP